MTIAQLHKELRLIAQSVASSIVMSEKANNYIEMSVPLGLLLQF